MFSSILNVCFGLITLCLMVLFELLLGNAFELRNGEKYLMCFVSRDKVRLVSHLLTLVLKVTWLD